ncbi:MFS transporter [Erwinia sp. SLM-02]|uniref:MFS transporter n=1 Tax=Erwinia sp. SLM-02 TaxID=3020057 RepID=UPI003080FE9A
MTTLETQQSANEARLSQRATRVVFLIAGIGMAAWAPLVPYAKDRAALSDASLGTLLLFLGLGSLIAMPLTGVLVGRYGCKRIITCGSVLLLVLLPLLATLSSPFSLALALMAFGGSIGMIDVAMNIQAVEVEKSSGKAMMSGFHGFFSMGGIVGAGLMSLILAMGMAPVHAVLAINLLLILLYLFCQSHILNERLHQPDTPVFVVPRGWVLFLGVLCFILFLAEGAILDWGALFLTHNRDMPAAQAGMGYAVFSVAMTIGRLCGDWVVLKAGRKATLLFGSLCAAAGFVLAITINDSTMTLVGFLLIGFGASNTVPILFSAAGNQKTMPINLAISAMTTIGYAGILAGPALIGFIAQLSSLSIAFSVVAALLLVVAACARLITR